MKLDSFGRIILFCACVILLKGSRSFGIVVLSIEGVNLFKLFWRSCWRLNENTQKMPLMLSMLGSSRLKCAAAVKLMLLSLIVFFLMVIKLKTEFCTCFNNIISYFAFVYYYNIYSTHTYTHTQYLLMCGQNDYKKVCQGNLRVKVVNITSDKWQILFVLILYSCAFSLKCSTKSTNL